MVGIHANIDKKYRVYAPTSDGPFLKCPNTGFIIKTYNHYHLLNPKLCDKCSASMYALTSDGTFLNWPNTEWIMNTCNQCHLLKPKLYDKCFARTSVISFSQSLVLLSMCIIYFYKTDDEDSSCFDCLNLSFTWKLVDILTILG